MDSDLQRIEAKLDRLLAILAGAGIAPVGGGKNAPLPPPPPSIAVEIARVKAAGGDLVAHFRAKAGLPPEPRVYRRKKQQEEAA